MADGAKSVDRMRCLHAIYRLSTRCLQSEKPERWALSGFCNLASLIFQVKSLKNRNHEKTENVGKRCLRVFRLHILLQNTAPVASSKILPQAEAPTETEGVDRPGAANKKQIGDRRCNYQLSIFNFQFSLSLISKQKTARGVSCVRMCRSQSDSFPRITVLKKRARRQPCSFFMPCSHEK